MDMPTDTERREVAHNIRENYVRGGLGYKVASAYNIAMAIGMNPGVLVGDIELWNRLADLIEPDTTTDTTKSPEFTTKCDRDALLALAEVLSTPELETDCGTCPLRKWCEEARDSGNRVTCFECKLWHTADVIREALGIEP